MTNDALSATDRILQWAIEKVGAPVVNWLTPAVAKALVEAIEKTSDEAKVGLVYGLLHRKIGELLNLGPKGAAPLLDALENAGVPRPAATEVVGNFLAALDKAIDTPRPN